eukprot:c11894_g1_i1.p2 GENE.c11894_g1_i1~~c11894_g1_i1.p2  ORF type:complete len:206 (+),score=31.34 c11894_g1_i1:53-670(+)
MSALSRQQLADLAATKDICPGDTPVPRRTRAAAGAGETPSPRRPIGKAAAVTPSRSSEYHSGSIKASHLGHTIISPRPVTSIEEQHALEATLGHTVELEAYRTAAALPIGSMPAGQTTAATVYHHRQLRTFSGDLASIELPEEAPYRSGVVVSSVFGQTKRVPVISAEELASVTLPPEPEYYSHVVRAKMNGQTSAGLWDPKKLP